MRQIALAKRQGFWDLRAAGNFIGGGTGTGLLMISAAAGLAGLEVTIPLLVGMGFVMAGLSLVWLEIGKPWRALNVFFHPQTSWMTREGILAAPLAFCTLGFVATGYPALLVAVMVLAGGFLYCQARILKASRGIPAWKQPEIVPFIIAIGLAEGTGAFLALGGEPSAAWITTALVAGLARAMTWRAYGQGLLDSKAPAGTLECLGSSTALALRAVGLAGLSLILLSLFVLPQPLAALGGILAATSGWGVKALIVTRAAFTRGPSIRHTPIRGRGVSRTVEA
ncbi:phenylacetyl-CoA:acceptor oxidoreductase [Paramagnetospirillum kuznetsovii]|uniref:Phenylacetyl-CoA:acceptor oxidoreductase n=1 Tax=Paramagnetospirillum kuznetsovii TaxID=2053833 RepID=A0A364NUC0_9PROT|nr:NrfD/PsrC family molybdoenzyme membrane anchor subunit [Paramagnetospirillum kuznetsovii]RAU20689.1 phenylacetyl-CoA:acceptor oxidoreductase [Paramagnetospirillum kuznetsovii]